MLQKETLEEISTQNEERNNKEKTSFLAIEKKFICLDSERQNCDRYQENNNNKNIFLSKFTIFFR